MCKSKAVRQVTVKEESEESFYLGAVNNRNKLEEALWTVSLIIGRIPVSFKISFHRS